MATSVLLLARYAIAAPAQPSTRDTGLFRGCQGRPEQGKQCRSCPRSPNNSVKPARPETSRCSRLSRSPRSEPTICSRWRRAISTCSRRRSISAVSCGPTRPCSSWTCPQMMAALEAELAQTTKHAEPPPLADRSRGALDFLMLQLSKVDWRKGLIGLGVVVALVVVFSAVLSWRQRDPLKGLKPGVYQSTQTRLRRHIAVAGARATPLTAPAPTRRPTSLAAHFPHRPAAPPR